MTVLPLPLSPNTVCAAPALFSVACEELTPRARQANPTPGFLDTLSFCVLPPRFGDADDRICR
jgi:hypothetical protein